MFNKQLSNLLLAVLFLTLSIACTDKPSYKLSINKAVSSNCKADLDVSQSSISIQNLFYEAEQFYSVIAYKDSNNNVAQFTIPQQEFVFYDSLQAAIELVYPNPCDSLFIPGVSVYNAFDPIELKIRNYYVPDIAIRNGIAAGDTFFFDYRHSTGKLINMINEGLVAIYYSDMGILKQINGDSVLTARAKQEIAAYHDKIFIYEIGMEWTPFNNNIDVSATFYSLEEIQALKASTFNDKGAYFISCSNKIGNRFNHMINMSIIEAPQSLRGAFNSEFLTKSDMLDRAGVIEAVTPQEISSFKGRAANLGQLCPTKCYGVKAYKASTDVYTFLN